MELKFDINLNLFNFRKYAMEDKAPAGLNKVSQPFKWLVSNGNENACL